MYNYHPLFALCITTSVRSIIEPTYFRGATGCLAYNRLSGHYGKEFKKGAGKKKDRKEVAKDRNKDEDGKEKQSVKTA